MSDKPRNYFCLDCAKHITPGDDDGLCPGCGSDAPFSYTDEDIGYTSIPDETPDTRTAIERSIDAEADRADVEYDRRVDDKITG